MASENVMEFTADNWEQEVIKSDKPVLVDFWAPWCGPCRALTPTVDRIATQYANRVKVGKLNIDDPEHPGNGDIAVKYGVTNIPRLLVFKGGDQPRDQLVGAQREDVIAKMLNRTLEA
jgi:thioredoxin 1